MGPNSGDCTSSIRPELLSAWANQVAADWVRHGAPARILSQPLLAGVLPLAQLNDEGVLESEDLAGDVEIFRNYAGIDEDEDVWSQVHNFVERGFLKAFDSLPKREEYWRGTPVELEKCIVSHYRGQQTWSMTSWTCCTNILWAQARNWISWCLILCMHFGTYH